MPEERKIINEEEVAKKVFFAAVAASMSEYKANLIKELEYNGYEIGQINPNVEDIQKIPGLLDEYDAAVHLMSENDTMLSQNGKGMETEQVELSVQHFLNRKLLMNSHEELFKIFVWHPRTKPSSIYEEQHLPSHLNKIQQLEEIDFVRTNFEDFKYYLLNNLNAEETQITDDDHFIKGFDPNSIYFLYDLADKTSAQTYIDYLRKRGCTVLTPDFSGDIMAVRQAHNRNLKSFDLVIIYAEQAGVNWVNMKIMDILKCPGLGRTKDIIGKAIVMPESQMRSCLLAARGFDLYALEGGTAAQHIDSFLNKNLL